MKKLILAILLCLPFVNVEAQISARRDTLSKSFKPVQIIAPASLMTAGLSVHFFAHDTWDLQLRDRIQTSAAGTRIPAFEDWLQYVPVTMDLGLGLIGAKAEHRFMDRLIEGSLAYLSVAILNNTAKLAFHTLRPNGADYRSFPSGHSVFAFTGAELVRLEYGWGWGSAAYAMATTVAVMRLWHNKHWLSDVLMGAGLGILCADMGRWLMGPVKTLLHLDGKDMKLAIAPAIDPFSGTMCTQLAFKF